MKYPSGFKLLSVVAALGFTVSACQKKEAPSPVAKSAPAPVSIGAEGDTTAPATGAAQGQSQEAPPIGTIDTASAKAPDVEKGKALIPISPTATPEIQAKLLTDALNVWEDWNGGKLPRTLQQLVEKRIVDQIPIPPQGMKFVIDSRKHAVVLQSE